MHEESSSRRKVDDEVHDGAVPAYLLDRENTTRAKASCQCIIIDFVCLHCCLIGHFVDLGS